MVFLYGDGGPSSTAGLLVFRHLLRVYWQPSAHASIRLYPLRFRLQPPGTDVFFVGHLLCDCLCVGRVLSILVPNPQFCLAISYPFSNR